MQIMRNCLFTTEAFEQALAVSEGPPQPTKLFGRNDSSASANSMMSSNGSVRRAVRPPRSCQRRIRFDLIEF